MKLFSLFHRHKSKPKSVVLTLTAAALVLAVGGGAAWLIANRSSHFEAQGVSFSYPASYDDLTFTAAPGVIARLKKADPDSVITLALEKGADVAAKMTHMNILDSLESNAAKSLPASYPSYKEDQSGRVKVDGFDASKRVFHYTGKDNHSAVYVNLLIIPRGHDAYYLTVESIDKNTSANDINLVGSSIKLP